MFKMNRWSWVGAVLLMGVVGWLGTRQLRVLAVGETAVSSSTVNYTTSTADIANPERGLYHYIETRASNPTLYNLNTLQGYRLNENITLIYCIHYLDDFVSSAISSSFLSHIQTNLDTVRQAGLKCILRFAYTDDWNNEEPPFGDATKTQILAHLDQLEPILQQNSDVIAVMQAGFIGVWGEWYYTDHFVDDPTTPWIVSPAQWANRQEVLERILTALPPSRMTAIRYVHAKQNTLSATSPLTVSTAYDGSYIARTGYHNDCFLASDFDFGTWLDATAKAFMATDSAFVVMGGETCFVNPPRSECPTALIELALFHWSYLNSEYHPDVLQDWVDDGCMETIRRSLGYRLQLLQGNYGDAVRPGDGFMVDVSLQNVGYAAPYNPRPVQLLLRQTGTGTLHSVALPVAPRFWWAGQTQNWNHTICVPNTMPVGTYELLLNLPDRAASLRTRPEYALLFANDGGVRESATGYNDLLHTLTVSAAAAANPCNSPLVVTPFDGLAVAPILTIANSGNDVVLNWITNSANCSYDVYSSLDPYFVIAADVLWDDTLPAGVATVTAVVPTSEAPRFYQVEGMNCDGTETAVSNRVGAFTYALEAGQL